MPYRKDNWRQIHWVGWMWLRLPQNRWWKINQIQHFYYIINLSVTVSTTSLCTTSSSECVIPFTYEDETYYGCVQPSWQDSLYGKKPWCPTVLDVRGKYDRDSRFTADCRPHCKVVSDMKRNLHNPLAYFKLQNCSCRNTSRSQEASGWDTSSQQLPSLPCMSF